MSKREDLTGRTFGNLTVIEYAGTHITSGGQRKGLWKCRCSCGNEIVTNAQRLKRGETKSCGCMKPLRTSERKLKDLSGKRFGRLTVQYRVGKIGEMVKWHCKCDCGNECDVLAGNLIKGHTVSCGCYREEVRPQNAFKHGLKHTRIYGVWEKMKSRCEDKSNPSYPRYGGRGITVCDEWKDNSSAFITWAYEHGYDENAKYSDTTIERIDNSKGYCPENCRIANAKEQANNRRTNRLITHNGETKTLAQWRDQFGMTQSKAYYHLVQKQRTIQYLIDKGIV